MEFLESQNTELKSTWRDEYLKWIGGFANAKGGKLFIGVSDDGQIIGVSNAKKLLEEIPNKIVSHLGLVCDVMLHHHNDKDFIEIVVKPSDYPVIYKGEYHIRSGATKQQLQGAALTEFLRTRLGEPWEKKTISGVEVDDLDKESFDIFRSYAIAKKRMTEDDFKISNEQLLKKLNLISDGKLTYAAILLFHRSPDQWIPGCFTKIGRFSSHANILYQDEVRGSLFLQAVRAPELLFLKYLIAPISFEGITRLDNYPYDKDAVREIYHNALIHSDWSNAASIQMRVYSDRLTISNDCALPTDWTADTLLQLNRSHPRNPLIANTFFRAGLIESWGTGIPKIIDCCQTYGNGNPQFVLHPNHLEVSVLAPHAQHTKQSDRGDRSQDDYEEGYSENTVGTVKETSSPYPLADAKEDPHENKTDAYDVRLLSKLMAAIQMNPRVTQEELAKELHISIYQVRKLTNLLVQNHRIKRIGGARGYWRY